MGYREYARHRGCALYAVQRAVATGRISATPDKKTASEAADKSWAACTDPAKAPLAPPPPPPMPLLDETPATVPEVAVMKRPEWPEWPNWQPPADEPKKPDSPPPDNVTGMDTFLAAKTERERAEAEMAKIALAEKQGKLIGAEAARRTWRQIGRTFAAAREQVPTQLAAQLVGKTDLNEIERIIRDALRDADTRVANEIQSRYGDLVADDRDRRVAG